jgi:ubiquinone/menaquinone biosynthesis C-methylase UbiE
MTRPAADFAAAAARYDELRPIDANWQELLDLMVREGGLVARRVLDVGCGTGTLATALAERGARVWGVDAEPAMLDVARCRVPRGVGVKEARAEALPFKDGWFDRVVMRLVLHLLDRPRALAEARRVLGPDGRLTVATFAPEHAERSWLAPLAPRIVELDRPGFPGATALAAEAEAAGFAAVRTTRLSQVTQLARADALERLRGRYISTLRLLEDAEFVEAVARAERDLPETVEVHLEWLVLVAEA